MSLMTVVLTSIEQIMGIPPGGLVAQQAHVEAFTSQLRERYKR